MSAHNPVGQWGICVYWESLTERGRPAARKRNLQDLLRLALAAVEIAATRREALDAVIDSSQLPAELLSYRHTVYETSVVYEFQQLARADFEAHGNIPVWERPIAYRKPGGTNWSTDHIDMALFPKDEGAEIRIEFGKYDPRMRRRPKRDMKLIGDATKLGDASLTAAPSKKASAKRPKPPVENFVLIWDERDSRDESTSKARRQSAKMTSKRNGEWLAVCREHAVAATAESGYEVVLEAVATISLTTFERSAHRTGYAAIYSVVNSAAATIEPVPTEQ